MGNGDRADVKRRIEHIEDRFRAEYDPIRPHHASSIDSMAGEGAYLVTTDDREDPYAVIRYTRVYDNTASITFDYVGDQTAFLAPRKSAHRLRKAVADDVLDVSADPYDVFRATRIRQSR